MGLPEENDAATEAESRVGRTLRDKWHLDALIDVGGMAAVYAATHRNGMRGAVKILHGHRAEDADITARFRREGYIANKVKHPNAVNVLDDDIDDDGNVFLVMELLAGTTLRERADERGGKLQPDEVLLLMDQLLDVLAVAHEQGIVHRDVKPENVFVTAEGQLKILDFGIAKLAEPTAREHSATMSGMPMGSPAFMSPEQSRGRWELVGPQSDVWSVGATMFTLLSGEDVHTAETVPELLAAIFTLPARSLNEVVPGAHPALVEVVDRALQLRLADRWTDARAMQLGVRRAYLEMCGSPIPARPWDLRPASKTVSLPEIQQALARTPQRTATTMQAEAGGSRSGRRSAVFLASFLLVGALGVAVAKRDTSAREMPGAQLAELGEQTSLANTRPESASPTSMPVAAVQQDTLPAPVVVHPRAAGSSSPVIRAHYPSIYDRRH